MKQKGYTITCLNNKKFSVAGLWDALDALTHIDDPYADDAPFYATKNSLCVSVNLIDAPHILICYSGRTKFGRIRYNFKEKTMHKEGYIPPRYKAEIQEGLENFLRSVG